MYGNGVRTGMEITAAVHRQIQQVLGQALTVCIVAAAGTLVQVTAAYLIATTIVPATVAAVSASASSAFLS